MQFDFAGEMDYYMPRFFESRSRDLLAQASGPPRLLNWSTPCRVHDYWLVRSAGHSILGQLSGLSRC